MNTISKGIVIDKVSYLSEELKVAQRNHHFQCVYLNDNKGSHYGQHWTRCPAPSCERTFYALLNVGYYTQSDLNKRRIFMEKLYERVKNKNVISSD